MAVFEYKALSAKGTELAGIIDADTPADARNKLRKRGVFPTDVVESEEKIGLQSEVTVSRLLRRVKTSDVAIFTRQLATLITAGLPLISALTALIEQLEKSPLKKVVIKVRDQINAGSTFADALAQHPRVFSPLYINMVKAGESAGALEVVLERLADLAEKSLKLRNRVRSIMVYPALVVVIGVLVVMFLLVKVVPSIIDIFAESRQALPLPTVVLINTSSFLRNYWWGIVLVLIGLYLLFAFWKKGTRGRHIVDSLKLHLPIFGNLIRKMSIVRFSQTLAILLSSGVPLLKSLDIVRKIVNNLVIGDAIEDAKVAIRAGKSVAEPFRKSRIFPPMVIHMITVGETSASLEDMLFKVAQAYEDEVETAVGVLTSVLEPLMILVMGGVVGFIVVSILLPIFQMSQLIQ